MCGGQRLGSLNSDMDLQPDAADAEAKKQNGDGEQKKKVDGAENGEGDATKQEGDEGEEEEKKKEKEPEPAFAMLSNPTRVLKDQLSLISIPAESRYKPVVRAVEEAAVIASNFCALCGLHGIPAHLCVAPASCRLQLRAQLWYSVTQLQARRRTSSKCLLRNVSFHRQTRQIRQASRQTHSSPSPHSLTPLTYQSVGLAGDEQAAMDTSDEPAPPPAFDFNVEVEDE